MSRVTEANSLFTLSLQQEVAAKAALTLVTDTVVLTFHTHSIILSRAFRYPGDDLKETCNRLTATIRNRGEVKRKHDGTLTRSGSSGWSFELSCANFSSSLDKHTSLFPLQNSRHGRHTPPPTAEPTYNGLHFSQ